MNGKSLTPRQVRNRELILQTIDDSSNGLGFNELHDMLKIHIGSKSTLSKLLKDLRYEHEIEKSNKDGKYRILDSSLFEAEAYLTSMTRIYVDEYSDKGRNPEKMIEAFINSIGVLSLYCAIEEIKTHRKWTKIASDYVSKINYLLAYLRRDIIYSGLELKNIKPTIPIVRELMSSKDVNLMEDSEFEARIVQLEEILREMCPPKYMELIDELKKI